MTFDGYTLFICVVVGFFIGMFVFLFGIGFPLIDDLTLSLEQIDCNKLSEIDIHFRSPKADNFVKDECF